MNKSLIFLMIFTLLVSTSCIDLGNMIKEPRLNVPELNVQGGVYNYEFPANIINMAEGTRAYFTLDGSEPNQSSMLYDSKVGMPITEGNTQLRVVAYDGKDKRSAELDERFTVTLSGPEYEQVDSSTYFVYIAQHEDHVYFTAQPFYNGLYKFTISTNTTELFIDKEVSRFKIIDDMIFYLSRYDLCRKHLSTGEDELLLSLNSEDLLADEEWIYYRARSGGGRLCRINVHTQQIEQINDIQADSFCLIDNYVIYTEWAMGVVSTKIYSYNLDSKETLLISLDSAFALQAKDGYVYYSNFSDGRHIYRIKPDGTESIKVVPRATMEYVVVGEWIYYSDMFGAEGIFRTKLDGTVEQSMGYTGNYLRFSRGHLYYRHPVSEEFFRINVFTTKREELGPLGPRSLLYFYGGNAYYTNATGLHWFSEKGGERYKID